MEKSNNIAVLILAAGTSSRLGQAKQLVTYQNISLLENACNKALNISNNVFVVLGAKQIECQEKIKNLNVKVVINNEYKEGLASSIKAGIQELLEYEQVLIMLCDQPFIPFSHFDKIINESKGNTKIICSCYNNKLAVPALFSKVHFLSLLQLNGDKGAKGIIETSEHKYISLNNDLAFDIDTNLDLIKLNKFT
ncbi:MAG: nucleotidyltransferase family protein [Campylobacteraceae bacterium]|nr:nucleotidyltransferase family protein [Campylobacteraceae bacterium]